MTGPLLVVLHLIPQAVLAGLFFVMGMQALSANGITLKILFLLSDRRLTPASPLKQLDRRLAIWIFVAIQLVGFGATFAITQTIAAVGFPIIILALVPVRTFLLPRWFTREELSVLDAPTASPFTMVSVGGNYGEEDENDGVDGVVGERRGEGSDEGVLVGGKDADSDEGRAERGEGSGAGAGARRMKRRESGREGRSGRWGEGEGFELQEQRRSGGRRSGSRQSK